MLAAAVSTWIRTAGRARFPLVWLGLVLVASFALIAPFVLNFDPEARGIGVVHVRRPFGEWLGDMALIYGILIWPLLAALVSRLARPPHTLALDRLGVAARSSPARCWPPTNLTGAMLVAVSMAAGIGAALSPAVSAPRASLILIAGGAALLLIPELLYLRDAFDGSALFRMNTVFKAGYQAFLLLGLAAGCALPWAAVWLPRRASGRLGGGRRGAADARARLPVRGRLRAHRRLRQRAHARRPEVARGALARRPGRDRLAARARAGDAVVLEAFGDDYSAFGHGRISTFTGRPTVIGWAGHEVQWQHDPGSRSADVRRSTRPPTSPRRGR